MKKHSVRKALLFSLIGSLSLSSCVTDVDLSNLKDNLKIDQSLVLPLGEASLTLADLLNKLDTTDLIATDQNSIFVQYTDSAQVAFREIVINDTSTPLVRDFSPLPPMTVSPGESVSVSYDDFLDLGVNQNLSDQRVDRLKANSVVLSMQIDKSNIDVLPENVKITLTFPNTSFTFDNGGGSVIEFTPTVFGTPTEMIIPAFTMNTPGGVLGMPVNIKLDVIAKATPIAVSANSSIKATVNFKKVDFKIAFGYFTPKIATTNIEQTVDLGDFQSSLPKGLFRLADPQIKLHVYNNVGVKMGVLLDYVKAYRKDEPAYTPVYAQFKNEGNSTMFVVDPPNDYGEIKETIYTLDKDSGRIDRFFDNELLPNSILYKYNLKNVGVDRTDFITPHAKVNVKFDVKVPLNLKSGSYYQMVDTIPDMSFDSLLNKDYIDHAILILKITNGLPVAADFKLQLLDASNAVIPTTIDTSYVINAAPVDASGLVLKDQLTTQTLQIRIEKSQLADLRLTKSIAYVLRVSGADGKAINFETTNSFKVKAGIFVKADYTLPSESNN